MRERKREGGKGGERERNVIYLQNECKYQTRFSTFCLSRVAFSFVRSIERRFSWQIRSFTAIVTFFSSPSFFPPCLDQVHHLSGCGRSTIFLPSTTLETICSSSLSLRLLSCCSNDETGFSPLYLFLSLSFSICGSVKVARFESFHP